MKLLFAVFALVWATQGSSFAQFFSVTHQDRNGNLQWTNLLCTTRPVYQILRSQSVTGLWTHVAYVTNQTRYTLSNAIPTGATAFYKLAWVEDVPVVLNYSFDEGLGIESIGGQITLNFSSLTASWNFEDAGFYDGPHPIGSGSGLMAFSTDLRTWFVLLRDAQDDTVYLGGFLQSRATASGCEYTGYAGTVFYSDSIGTEQIGEFTAVKP